VEDDLEDFKRTFFEESADLLSQAEQHLMTLSEGEPSAESLGAIFRAVHSIKGGAGAFGMERLVKFTHSFESVLDALRSGKIALDKDRHTLLMRGFDVVSDLVREAKGDVQLPEDREAPVLDGLNDWYPLQGHGGGGGGNEKAAAPAEKKKEKFLVRFKPLRTLFSKANEPILLLRQLAALGDAKIACATGGVPTLDRMDPEEGYLNWIIQIETEVGQTGVNDIFEFVDVDCELAVSPLAEGPQVLDHSPMHVTADAAAPPAPGLPAVQAQEKGGEKAQPKGEDKASTVSSIRVDLDKIDRLGNMVGEIVITQAMVAQQLSTERIENQELLAGIEALQQHTRELQDSVMSIRAQPVKSVFQRMPRLVRELAGTLGKEIKLVTLGENTEVDKTVIEQLSDPLTHMIRNSIDHGIEMPAKREAAGKPREGTIHLSAEHRSGRILIQIVDDGGGINREKVKEICISKGLISPDAQLSDEEIDNFIFLPGFSTADKVSNISGRGVGMDVVKKNIQALGGRVHVQLRPGHGSRFILSLPLTLAVLDGMIVTVGEERYVLPLTSIIELLRPEAEMLSKLVTHGDLIHIRGEYIRLLHLHEIFDIKGAITNPADSLIVLVEIDGSQKVGIVVDEVIGQQQVVIKTLESNYRQIEGVSAATILGDGRVALILDVVGLRQMMLASNAHTTAMAEAG
jgi:two-component system chemotaxis sensor kinase CheA